MAIKLYFDISTYQYLGKITDGETWVQGDDDSKELQLYFGLGSPSSFTNGLTNVTIFDYQCRVAVTRPDGETATLSTSQITSGSEGYYKLVIDSWVTNSEGTLEIDSQRYTSAATISYGQATIEIEEGTPSADEGYATKSELATVELKVDNNTADKHNKSAIITTVADQYWEASEIGAPYEIDVTNNDIDTVSDLETAYPAANYTVGDKARIYDDVEEEYTYYIVTDTPTVDTEVNSTNKTTELLVANSTTDQAYTNTEVSKVLDGTKEYSKINIGGCEVTYDDSCRNLEADLGNDVILQIGEENFICATNKSGVSVSSPTVCEIIGSTGNKVAFDIASNDENPTGNIGIATETIANNANGKLTHFGLVRNVDTTAISGSPVEGAVIYLGTNGGMTTIKPTAPNTIIRLGNIVTANASVGVIFIDIQSAGQFKNQSDVYFNGGLVDRDIPVYNETNVRWEAINLDTELADLFESVSYATDTHILTFTQHDGSTQSLDLPLESTIVSASYDNTTKDLTFTLQSGSTLVVPLDDIISGLASEDYVDTADALRVPKDLSSDTPILYSAVPDEDTAFLPVDVGGTFYKINLTNIYTGANVAAGSFSPSGDFSGDGLIANAAINGKIVALTGSSGQYLANIMDIADTYHVVIEMPDTSADTTATTQISFDNGTTYRYLQINGEDIPVASLSGEILHIYRDGSTLKIYVSKGLDYTMTHKATVNSTYGEIAPLNEGTPEIVNFKGLTIENVVENGNFEDGTTDWDGTGASQSVTDNILSNTGLGTTTVPRSTQSVFTIGVDYFAIVKVRVTNSDCLVLSLRDGTGVTLDSVSSPNQNEWYYLKSTFTATTTDIFIGHTYVDNATANGAIMEVEYAMAIPITNTPYASDTASQWASRVPEYIDGETSITNPTVGIVGKNLANYRDFEDGTFLTVTLIENGINIFGKYSGILPLTNLKKGQSYVMSAETETVSGTPDIKWRINYKNIASSALTNLGTAITTDSEDDIENILLYVESSGVDASVNFTNIQIEEGTTTTDYVPHHSEQVTYTRKDGNDLVMRSVGTAQDGFTEIDGILYKEANVGYDNITGIVSVDTTNYPLAKDGGSWTNYLTAGGQESGIIGTDSTTGDGLLHYELATPDTSVEIEQNGTWYQEEVTTITQLNNIAGELSVKYNLDSTAQILTNANSIRNLQEEHDELETKVETNISAIGTLTDLTTTEKGSLVGAVNELDSGKVDVDGDKVLSDNNFTDTLKTKLDGIEENATADQTDAEIKTAYENNSDTNAYTDTAKGKVDKLTVTANVDLDKVIEWKAILSSGSNVSSSTTAPSSNLTLSESYNNFDWLWIDFYRSGKYYTVKIPTNGFASGRQYIATIADINTGGIYYISFRLERSTDTGFIAYYGAYGTSYTADATISILEIYGGKL